MCCAIKESEPNLSGLSINSLEFVNENGDWISTSARKKGSAGVQGRDYPTPTLQIEFEQYEIVDANGLVTTVTMKDDIIAPAGHEILTGEEDVDTDEDTLTSEENKTVRFLKGSSSLEFSLWKTDVSILCPRRLFLFSKLSRN